VILKFGGLSSRTASVPFLSIEVSSGPSALSNATNHETTQQLRGYNNKAKFSPDGRWVAYESNESGRAEIYLVPFQGAQNKRQVSTSGGSAPHWRRDGTEIFYVTVDGTLMAVPFAEKQGGFNVGSAKPLFRVPGYDYDVSPDGTKFISYYVSDPNSDPIALVLNWTDLLKK
jgi:eukaryotic-like serine/threonine-protein kinase